MGIFLRQSHNVKPRIWGSFADVQYSIWRNLEDIYGCDHKSEVLIMPLFWGLPLLDYSGYNNHGTNHGATYKDGSLDFDGDNDNINLGSITSGNSLMLNGSDITISVWINPTMTGDSYQRIIDKSTAGAGVNGYTFSINGEVATHYTTLYVNGDVWSRTSQEPTANELNHLVVSGISGSIARIYINGNEVGIYGEQANRTISDATANMRIGTWNHDTGREYNGIIDEGRIAKAVRTPDQIGLFYENPYGLYRRVVKPIWSIPAAPSIYIPQIIMF